MSAVLRRRPRRRMADRFHCRHALSLIGLFANDIRRWSLDSATAIPTKPRHRRRRRSRTAPCDPVSWPGRRLIGWEWDCGHDGRRHHRLRIGQPALGGQGLRAGDVREADLDAPVVRVTADRREWCWRPSGWCCPASAPLPTARRGLMALPGMAGGAAGSNHTTSGRPFLGICVGMQLMAEFGREYEQLHEGLGWIPGEVDRRWSPPIRRSRFPIWAGIRAGNRCRTSDHPVLAGNPTAVRTPISSTAFISRHGLHRAGAWCWRDVDYGGPVTAMIGRDNMDRHTVPSRERASGRRPGG